VNRSTVDMEPASLHTTIGLFFRKTVWTFNVCVRIEFNLHWTVCTLLWGVVHKNIVSDRFSTEIAISAHIYLSLRRDRYLCAH